MIRVIRLQAPYMKKLQAQSSINQMLKWWNGKKKFKYTKGSKPKIIIKRMEIKIEIKIN
jgi:hypothetical protein